MKKNKYQQLKMMLASSIIVGVLIFSLLTLKSIMDNDLVDVVIFFGLTFAFLSLSRIPLGINAIKDQPNKIIMIKNFSFAFIYLVFSILIFVFIPFNAMFICGVASVTYLFTIAANRICICVEKKKKVITIVFNALLAFICICVAFIFMSKLELFESFIIVSDFIIMIVSIVEILAFAFSQMKLKGLLKIMKETYAFEVLYGLIVLIFSFSVYFMVMEESIPTYGDALWYSFAIVTTIGFGDFTVVGIASRILSVILGIYGIVVVAVLTSVIVNYYNEVKSKRKSEEDKEENSIENVEQIEQEDKEK